MSDHLLDEAAHLGIHPLSVSFTFGTSTPGNEFKPLDDTPVSVSLKVLVSPGGSHDATNVPLDLDPDFLNIVKAIAVLYAHLSSQSRPSQVDKALRDSVSQRMEASALRRIARALADTREGANP